jgi:hypothetical protein
LSRTTTPPPQPPTNSHTNLNCFGGFGGLGINLKFGFQLRRSESWAAGVTEDASPPYSPAALSKPRPRSRSVIVASSNGHVLKRSDSTSSAPAESTRRKHHHHQHQHHRRHHRNKPIPPMRAVVKITEQPRLMHTNRPDDTVDDILTNRHDDRHSVAQFLAVDAPRR